jgi:TrmH family RNA methyltransferase
MNYRKRESTGSEPHLAVRRQASAEPVNNPCGRCRKMSTLISPSLADRLHVVLVRTRNPLNIGAAARAMSNFGFRTLRLVNPYEAAFREARSAVGAHEVLANARGFKTVADAVADCTVVIGTTAGRNRRLQQPVRPLDRARIHVRKQLQSGAVGLLFGSEKVGLSTEDLSHCHWLIHIPTEEEHLSMNLGQAVAVCLYEFARSTSREKSSGRPKPATAGDVQRITAILFAALDASGYVKLGAAASTEAKIRHLIRRLNLQSDDAEVILGMLRKIQWKLTQQEER